MRLPDPRTLGIRPATSANRQRLGGRRPHDVVDTQCSSFGKTPVGRRASTGGSSERTDRSWRSGPHQRTKDRIGGRGLDAATRGERAPLSGEHVAIAQAALGTTQFAAAINRTSPQSRKHLQHACRRFRVGGNSSPRQLSGAGPIVDYGGWHPNESHLAAPIDDLSSSVVGRVIGAALQIRSGMPQRPVSSIFTPSWTLRLANGRAR